MHSDELNKSDSGVMMQIFRPLRKFFMGRIYPAIVAALVLIGHVTALEYYFNIPIILMLSLALVICDSIKPFIIVLLTFVFQVTKAHTPGFPTWSDYYFVEWRLVFLFILGAILLAAMIYRFVKILAPRLRPDSPMLLPLSLLSVAFVIGGAFSKDYSPASLVYGLAQVLVFFVLFYVLYYGLEGESTEELRGYAVYVTVLVAAVLVGELLFVYLTYDDLFLKSGEISKTAINLGWGVCNPIGMCLTVLIPLQVYGATAYKRPWIYLVTAMVTYIFALMTLSRNTMLFATLITAVSLLLGCFVGRNKLLFRIFVPICVLGLASVVILSSDKLSVLLATVIEYGFSDNGRFKLWETGFDNFKESPILGKGFFGFGGDGLDATANFLPLMAHNTVIELLSALGVFGLLAYGYYRVSSLKPLFKKPRCSTVYVYLSIAAVLLMSLLDNYVFYIYTMFYYSVMLALAYRCAAADPESSEKIAQNARESEE